MRLSVHLNPLLCRGAMVMPVSGWPSRQHYSSDGLAKPSIGRSRRRPSGGSSVSGAPMKGAPNGKLSSVRSRQQGRPSPPSRTKAIRAAGVALRSHGAPGSEAEILCIACAILHISRIRSPVSMAIEDELEKLYPGVYRQSRSIHAAKEAYARNSLQT